MNLIEEATKRLQQLEQAGIGPPLAAKPLPQPLLAVAAERAHKRAAAADGANFRTIDCGRLQAAGFITPAVQDSKLVHEFRVIKRPLIHHALGKVGAARPPNANLIMVTSALAGEGKTFVALNLAMSLAMEVDCTVLLVDADVVSPSIPTVLGIEPAMGLMDVLTGQAGCAEVLLRTNVERLSLCLAGMPQRGASELLASDGMARLLGEISSRYADRIVVFDSPPLLATTESRVLATNMGQVLVVVEAERTTHAALESALATLESCPMVLTMLNKAPESNARSYYGDHAYGR